MWAKMQFSRLRSEASNQQTQRNLQYKSRPNFRLISSTRICLVIGRLEVVFLKFGVPLVVSFSAVPPIFREVHRQNELDSLLWHLPRKAPTAIAIGDTDKRFIFTSLYIVLGVCLLPKQRLEGFREMTWIDIDCFSRGDRA